MACYRKRPVVIEAEQYWPDDAAIPEGVVELPAHVADRLISRRGLAWIETLEGGHIVSPGDYVITGVRGERYPVKPDIFEATYEPVEE